MQTIYHPSTLPTFTHYTTCCTRKLIYFILTPRRHTTHHLSHPCEDVITTWCIYCLCTNFSYRGSQLSLPQWEDGPIRLRRLWNTVSIQLSGKYVMPIERTLTVSHTVVWTISTSLWRMLYPPTVQCFFNNLPMSAHDVNALLKAKESL